LETGDPSLHKFLQSLYRETSALPWMPLIDGWLFQVNVGVDPSNQLWVKFVHP
jgi:hypothetical protein